MPRLIRVSTVISTSSRRSVATPTPSACSSTSPAARALNGTGVVPWQPDPGIRHDVLELAIQALPDDGQRDRLRETLQPVVDSEVPGEPPIDEAVVFVGDAAHVFDLFTARDREAAQRAVDALSPQLHEQLAGISPTTYADAIDVPVYLLHGVTDTSIPFAHAELLKDALGERVKRLTQFGRFGHAQPGSERTCA